MSIYDFKVERVDGSEISLKEYKGKVLLIVNTATGCGYTPQYEGLENLYEKYKDEDFEILDFPCNQFLNQAPGTNEEIANFCRVKFATDFETFAKIEVNGENTHPLYKYLKKEAPEEIDNGLMKELYEKLKGIYTVIEDEIHWNFTKFLIDREGNIVARFAPSVTPEEVEPHIKELL
jgi:glutathione peroxidase